MKQKNNSFPLFESVKTVITETQQYVVRNVNAAMTLAYFRIGKMIVEDEQNGNERAAYSQETLKKLSVKLTEEFGRGYSNDNLEFMRKFYLTYQKYEILSHISENRISESLIRKFENPLKLSWTHYIQLLKIKSDDERSFYEIEAVNNNWSVRELQRQYSSSLFERLALSTDKEGVKQKLTHQDLGQMQMYVNYYDRMIKSKDENPTIGIVLCKEENKTVIEFTLPEDNKQIFAKEYKAVLPSKEQLKKQLE